MNGNRGPRERESTVQGPPSERQSEQYSLTKILGIEGVIWQLKDYFGLERHRAKSLGGLLTRLAAKVAAYTVGQVLNERLGRPLRGFAELLI